MCTMQWVEEQDRHILLFKIGSILSWSNRLALAGVGGKIGSATQRKFTTLLCTQKKSTPLFGQVKKNHILPP